MLHIKQNNSGFTLIELLVAIVILVTLSTGAFVGYSGYTMSSRDSSRISDLKNLYQGIQVASSQLGEAPRPDSALKIYSSTGVLLSEQWSLGENVKKSINVESGGKDPKDSTLYTYLRFKDGKSIQLLAFSEKDGLANTLALSPISLAYATDYTERFPLTIGRQLGILLENGTNTPLDQISSFSNSGANIGLLSTGTGILVASNSGSVIENLADECVAARVLLPDVILEEKPKTFPSCKAFLESDPTAQSGIYYITPDPAGSPVKVYCDMTTDGGGWTMLLASGLSGPEFGPTGAFWNGTSNSTKTYRYDCRDYKASDMEALIRSLAFDEIKFNHYGQNIYSSTTNSTFVAKKSATTPWINKSGNIGTLAWNGSDPSYGWYTQGNYLLGIDFGINYVWGEHRTDPTYAIGYSFGDTGSFSLGSNFTASSNGGYFGTFFYTVGSNYDWCWAGEGCPTGQNINISYGVSGKAHRNFWEYWPTLTNYASKWTKDAAKYTVFIR